MKLDKNILHIISKYLHQKETTEERQQLYEWYEEFGNADVSIDKKAAIKLERNGKARLLAEINGDKNRANVVKLFRYRLAAACIALILCSVSLIYFLNRDVLTPLKQAELEAIVPKHSEATITLSTGQVLNLDTLQLNKSISIGNMLIQKDVAGQVTYTSVNKNASKNVINTLQTSKATQYSILLSDGTKVYLNATSKLSFPENFGEGNRVVELHGEAYFEVKKTLQHSKFLVKTDGQLVEVLGTKFNINAYEDLPAVKTTLAEGSVRMTPVNKTLKPILLKPNQQSILNKNSVALAQVDAEMIIAWKDGFFVFDGNNKDEIIREIGKWYDIDIDYKPGIKSMAYTGRIPKNINMAQLMKLLNYAGIKVQAFKDKNNQHKLIIN